MRVAIHHPERTEPDGTAVPASVSAYRLGRITDQVDVVTGETTPAATVASALLAQAEAEFPGHEIHLERLVCNGDETFETVTQEDGSTASVGKKDGTSTWVHHEQVPAGAVSPEGTVIAAPELTVAQPQTTGGEQQ